MQNFHSASVNQILEQLNTDLQLGLTSEKAEQLQKQYGLNQTPEDPPTPLWEKIKEQFEDILVRILLVAAIISFFFAVTGDNSEQGLTAYVEPFVILVILILNAVIGIWQDEKAQKAIQALKSMQALKCTVLREGKLEVMDSKFLVPGDIVEVKTGDKCPADCRLVKKVSVTVQVNQSALTGENRAVYKQTTPIVMPKPQIQDKKNMIFSSTVVTYGTGIAVVCKTGTATEIGQIEQDVKEGGSEKTPLKIKLQQFGTLLSYIIMVICILVWLINIRNFWDPMHGSVVKGAIYYLKIAIALAVAAIPEGLPAVITTCLALGTQKMAKNNAIVRTLPSVQTLGCTTIICSDKTGTITTNQMTAVKVIHIGKKANELVEYQIQGTSYSPIDNAKITQDQYKQNKQSFDDIVKVAGMCNNAKLCIEKGQFQKIGGPTEGAMKVAVEKLGRFQLNYDVDYYEEPQYFFRKHIKPSHTLVATLEFENNRKMMSVLVRQEGKQYNELYIKGASERVIDACDTVQLGNGESVELTDQDKVSLKKQMSIIAGQGLRCLALAIKRNTQSLSNLTQENAADKLGDVQKYPDIEKGGALIGFFGIKDPIRPQVPKALQLCQTAGIDMIMITGDSKDTALSIAQELGMGNKDEIACVTGSEFQELGDDKIVEIMLQKGGKVFSRVAPRHKRDLVELLIEKTGNIVAMTGDGVNDAPALSRAHIGIAMGIAGTEVAKQASDMVLADDNFGSIVKAVEEGRAIYNNMKAFIRYLISSNIGEVVSIFLTAALGVPEGLNSVQLLWVNLVTDGPPATALGFNPHDADIMLKPPRKQDDGLISGFILFRYTIIGLYVGLATVGIFVYWYTYANTGDGHTLVTFDQLRNWSECSSWQNFSASNFRGLQFANSCQYFTKGKVVASTLSLSVLVVIEMLNALNALSEDGSLLQMPPWRNIWLILAICNSILIHTIIVYVPFLNQIFSITALTLDEWILVFCFSAPVIFLDEVLKFISRILNRIELRRRLKEDKSD